LNDLKLFLECPDLLNDLKIVSIFEGACKGAAHLDANMNEIGKCRKLDNEFGRLNLRIEGIKNSPRIREALQKECLT
jgi:hypothetical protein